MAIKVINVSFQALLSPTSFERFVEDTIVFVQEPFRRTIRVSNVSFQILTQEFGASILVVTQDLGIDDTVSAINAIGDRQIVNDPIVFQQMVFSPSHPTVVDTLFFTDLATSSIQNKALTDLLGIHDQAESCFGAPWTAISIVDEVTFIQKAGQGRSASATDAIVFVDAAANIQGLIGDGHFIDFIQIATVSKGLVASSTITFTHGIQSFSDFLRSVTDADIVQQSFTYYIDDPCNRKQYSRFMGEGNSSEIPVERMIFDSDFVLEATTSGVILVLRSPETDDNDRLGFSRINRETRGGELNIFSDPTWAEVNTLIFTVTALPDGHGNCPDTMEALLTFLQNTLGEEILLHDWTGTSWRGVITTPDEAAVEDADGYWTVTFEFEGTEQPGSVPQNVIAMTHTVGRIMHWHRTVNDAIPFVDSVSGGGALYVSVSDAIAFTQAVGGTYEKIIMFDNLGAGSSAVTLNNTSPTTGIGLWRSHTNIKDNGTMTPAIDAGAYFTFNPVSGTRYEVTFAQAFVDTYNPGDNAIFGFFEAKSVNGLVTGSGANGSTNPTTAKAVHLMRKLEDNTVDNAYRIGSDSDGTADTRRWTDATLRDTTDDVLDLRIILDTRGGDGNWKAQWFAKGVISPNYTEVGPLTDLLSENIGAVGWASDDPLVDTEVISSITLKELRSL